MISLEARIANRASVGEEVLDNEAVKRIKEIQNLPPDEKEKVISVVDALIRDYKTKQAYQ